MIPTRIRWAVDLLDVRRDAHLLEVGCGNGEAAALVAARLAGAGRLVAIDRSPTMVARARSRNAAAIASGRVVVAQQSLADAAAQAAPHAGTFDEIFAINVNGFWTAPAASMDALVRLGRWGAVACLAYEPPTRQRLRELATAIPAAMQAAGLAVTDVLSPDAPGARLLAVRARLPRTSPTR